MAVAEDDFNSLRIQFYAVTGVIGFLVIVSIAVVIDLAVKVYKLRKGEIAEEESESEQRSLPPTVDPDFAVSKPKISSWQGNHSEIRRQNDRREFSIPKPSISKNWKSLPGERSGVQPKRDFGSDLLPDDVISNLSYDERKPPPFRNTGSGFRNPFSGNDLDRNFDLNDGRSNKTSRFPGLKQMSTNSDNNFTHGGSDNYGYKRDFQQNNYY